MLGGDTSVNDSNINIGSISSMSTKLINVKKSTPEELAPIEEVKGNTIPCLHQDILNPQKTISGDGGGLEKKCLPDQTIQEKDQIFGIVPSKCSSREGSHLTMPIGGGSSSTTISEKTIDMISLSVPVKPELKGAASSEGDVMAFDLAVLAGMSCKGSDTVQHTVSTPHCGNEGKTETATDSIKSREGEGGTVGPNEPPAELKPEQLSLDNTSNDDLSELVPISKLIPQKRIRGKTAGGGGASKPQVGPGELWVKDDLVLSVSLINKMMEFVSEQMTSAIEILRDKWCGCGMALECRHPQYAPAVDWESISNKINDEAWTPKLCQAIWKYLAYADLTVADLLANPSPAIRNLELEEDSDQDDFFVDSIKLNVRNYYTSSITTTCMFFCKEDIDCQGIGLGRGVFNIHDYCSRDIFCRCIPTYYASCKSFVVFQRRDSSNNKRKRLWGRGIINWPYFRTEDKGSVISLLQGPKKPKSRRRVAMSAHATPCINLCPPVACGPQTSCAALQPAATTTTRENSHLLINVAKLPLPTPIPVLDIGMLCKSAQAPNGDN